MPESRVGPRRWSLPLVGLVLCLSAGPGHGQASKPHPGDRILGEAGCLHCHAAPAQVQDWLDPRGAPDLRAVGARVSVGFLRRYLARPASVHPDAAMPDVLAGVPSDRRDEVVEDLVHFLQSLGGPFDATPVEVDGSSVPRGERLFHRLGCVPCHGPAVPPDGERTIPSGPPPRVLGPDLARKTNVPALAAFLRDPVSVRPSGRMPSLRLGKEEAQDIATWLLRDQDRDETGALRPPQRFAGLTYDYYEARVDEYEPDLDALTPAGGGVAPRPTVDVPRREEEFALVFRGTLTIPRNGTWTLTVTSDDGSWLHLDGELLVSNGGVHAMQEASATRDLAAGDHDVQVTMFEHNGGEGLVVAWEGPGTPRQVIPDEYFTHQSRALVPPDASPLVPEADRVARGRQWFRELRCGACHDLGEDLSPPAPAPDLAALDLAKGLGCAAPEAAEGRPHYEFREDQRADLRDALQRQSRWRRPPPAALRLEHRIQALGCRACHARGEEGGPNGLTDRYFTMDATADLGDEGRVPPPLHDVGRKLQETWLAEVLQEGGSVRPYMHTRMPQYGAAATAELVGWLAQVDGGDRPATTLPFQVEMAEVGRLLVGTRGLSCISCHRFQGHESLGMPGLDLALNGRRLRHEWFREFLSEPIRLRPGTRMPTYWYADETTIDVLDGDQDRQMDAIWTYLALGDSAPLPVGVQVEPGSYDLMPGEETRLVGVFMEGVSPKVLAVGFPERVNYAFDQQHVRVARLWRGPFLNVEGTWRGRAGALERPPADARVVDLPPGPALALLASPDAAWPEDGGVPGGPRRRAIRYDGQRRPTFQYQLGEVTVEETLTPEWRADGAVLMRRFQLRAPRAPRGLTLRLGVGDDLEGAGSRWRAGPLRLTLDAGAEPTRLDVEGTPELRWRLDRTGESGKGGWLYDFEVELSW